MAAATSQPLNRVPFAARSCWKTPGREPLLWLRALERAPGSSASDVVLCPVLRWMDLAVYCCPTCIFAQDRKKMWGWFVSPRRRPGRQGSFVLNLPLAHTGSPRMQPPCCDHASKFMGGAVSPAEDTEFAQGAFAPHWLHGMRGNRRLLAVCAMRVC